MTSELWPVAATYDFDGTIALTNESCPGGVDVDGAYAAALSEVFDAETAEQYLATGGHQSRTPQEIVEAARPSLPPGAFERAYTAVTQHKLDILLAQIGTILPNGERWPRPTTGFPESWQEVYERRSGQKIIGTSIISAGHHKFIARWFETFDLPTPDSFTTIETIDRLRLQLPPSQLAKPSPFVMGIALDGLRNAYGTTFNRVVHHGDSQEKDGQLARNTGAEYIHITPESAAEAWRHSIAVLLGTA